MMKCNGKNYWDKSIQYFSKKELACKGTGIIKLDIRFAKALPQLRKDWGRPLTPTSVCRTPEHNKNVGGHPRSLHLTENPTHPTYGTMAADIYWKKWDIEAMIDFAELAYDSGFAVGLHNTFCHIDLREAAGLNKTVFLYGTWDNRFTPDIII